MLVRWHTPYNRGPSGRAARTQPESSLQPLVHTFNPKITRQRQSDLPQRSTYLVLGQPKPHSKILSLSKQKLFKIKLKVGLGVGGAHL